MKVIYLEGDPCAPKYLGAALEVLGHEVLRTAGPPHPSWDADLVVVSDLQAGTLGDVGARRVVELVQGGAGLLLVGGWHSYGSGGWGRTPLADVSPVRMEAGDDRVNTPSGTFLRRVGRHAATEGLPWLPPPVITGYNRVIPRVDASVIVEGVRVDQVGDDIVTLAGDDLAPILVLGSYPGGRTAAFLGDLAPHWSGGLTDWGPPPLAVGAEELGRGYVRFVGQLCGWLGGVPLPAEAEEETAGA